MIFTMTATEHGPDALVSYRALIQIAIEDIVADPSCAGSRERTELGLGIRSYHLHFCRRRVKLEGGCVDHAT